MFPTPAALLLPPVPLLTAADCLLLSLQEDEELEAELGVALDSSTPQHPLERALQLLEKHDAASAVKLLEHHIGTGTSRRRQLSSVAIPSSQQGVQPQSSVLSSQQQEELREQQLSKV